MYAVLYFSRIPILVLQESYPPPLLLLLFKDYFKGMFRFTEKLNGKYRDFSIIPLYLCMHVLPCCQQLPSEWHNPLIYTDTFLLSKARSLQ